MSLDKFADEVKAHLEDKTFQFEGETLRFVVQRYSKGRRVRIDIVSDVEPWAALTVNLPECNDLADDELFVKTWSENTAISAAVLALGLFEDTGRRARGVADACIWKLKK